MSVTKKDASEGIQRQRSATRLAPIAQLLLRPTRFYMYCYILLLFLFLLLSALLLPMKQANHGTGENLLGVESAEHSETVSFIIQRMCVRVAPSSILLGLALLCRRRGGRGSCCLLLIGGFGFGGGARSCAGRSGRRLLLGGSVEDSVQNEGQ